jgi:hypothetical protein
MSVPDTDNHRIPVERRYGPDTALLIARQGWLTSIDHESDDYDDRFTLWLNPEQCEQLAAALTTCATRARVLS